MNRVSKPKDLAAGWFQTEKLPFSDKILQPSDLVKMIALS
jgi:hypothetical protein